jgi:hypothetical protein
MPAFTANNQQNLTAAQTTPIYRNGQLVATRRGINIVPSTNVTVTVADDSASDKVDVTISATGQAGSGGVSVYDDGVLRGAASSINFSSNLSVTLANGVAQIDASVPGGNTSSDDPTWYNAAAAGIVPNSSDIGASLNTLLQTQAYVRLKATNKANGGGARSATYQTSQPILVPRWGGLSGENVQIDVAGGVLSAGQRFTILSWQDFSGSSDATATFTATATTTSSRTAYPAGMFGGTNWARFVYITNSSSTHNVYVKSGTSSVTATASDLVIGPGLSRYIVAGGSDTHLAAIMQSGASSTTLTVKGGAGDAGISSSQQSLRMPIKGINVEGGVNSYPNNYRVIGINTAGRNRVDNGYNLTHATHDLHELSANTCWVGILMGIGQYGTTINNKAGNNHIGIAYVPDSWGGGNVDLGDQQRSFVSACEVAYAFVAQNAAGGAVPAQIVLKNSWAVQSRAGYCFVWDSGYPAAAGNDHYWVNAEIEGGHQEYNEGMSKGGEDYWSVNTTLTTALDSGATTTVQVADGSAITNGMWLTIDEFPNSEQVIVVSGGGTNTLTVTRNQNWTSYRAHAAGACVINGSAVMATFPRLTHDSYSWTSGLAEPRVQENDYFRRVVPACEQYVGGGPGRLRVKNFGMGSALARIGAITDAPYARIVFGYMAEPPEQITYASYSRDPDAGCEFEGDLRTLGCIYENVHRWPTGMFAKGATGNYASQLCGYGSPMRRSRTSAEPYSSLHSSFFTDGVLTPDFSSSTGSASVVGTITDPIGGIDTVRQLRFPSTTTSNTFLRTKFLRGYSSAASNLSANQLHILLCRIYVPAGTVQRLMPHVRNSGDSFVRGCNPTNYNASVPEAIRFWTGRWMTYALIWTGTEDVQFCIGVQSTRNSQFDIYLSDLAYYTRPIYEWQTIGDILRDRLVVI